MMIDEIREAFRPLPQMYFSKIMRAIVEFELIGDGDKIIVGLSGGKDSLFLLYALAQMRPRLKKSFSLAALTIDPLFSADFAAKAAHLGDFCAALGVPHEIRAVDIRAAIKNVAPKGGIRSKENRPCFTCAYFRRGAVNRFAAEQGGTKVAYAHHHDDAVETLVMGLLSSGQIATFLPKTYLSRCGVTVIRPLVYLREQEIIAAQPLYGFAPLKSPCPYDGKTRRQATKDLIRTLAQDDPLVCDHLGAAIRESAVGALWPAAKSRAEMAAAYREYVKGQKG